MDFQTVIQELGIDKLPEEEQQTIFEQLIRELHMSVGQRLAQTLNDDQQKQLQQIAQDKGRDAAMDELATIYPGINKIYQEELVRLKDDLKSLMS